MSPVEIGKNMALAQPGSGKWLWLIDRYMNLAPEARVEATKEFFLRRSPANINPEARAQW